MKIDRRPRLNRKISVKDFRNFYWLKTELVKFCREVGMSGVGGKIEIANRIVEYLKTGKVVKKVSENKVKLPKPTEPLTKNTIIGTDQRGYKEKKDFLKTIIGNNFHFTIHLLDWFKKNTGKKTYGDLINEWHKEQKLRRDSNYKKEIAPQFEYNTYIRDFLKDNKNKTRKDAIMHWKIKKSTRGDNIYNKSDLK